MQDFVNIKNKKLYKYLYDSFGAEPFSVSIYDKNWLVNNEIFIPHIANDYFDDYLLVGEDFLVTEQELENEKIYFYGNFEGKFLLDNEKLLLTKYRIVNEFSKVVYFIVIKLNKIYGLLVPTQNSGEEDLFSIADFILGEVNYIKNKNVLRELKVSPLQIKQKIIHFLKMAQKEIDEDTLDRIAKLVRGNA